MTGFIKEIGGVWKLVLTVALDLGVSVSMVLLDYSIGLWTKDYESQREGIDNYYLKLILCSVTTFFIMRVSLFSFCFHETVKLARSLTRKAMLKLLNAPLNKYFDVTPIGNTLTAFSVDFYNVDVHITMHGIFFVDHLIDGLISICLSMRLLPIQVVLPYSVILYAFYTLTKYSVRSSVAIKKLWTI